MVSRFSEHISVELAKKLQAYGMHLFEYVVYDDGAPYFDDPGPDEEGWADGHRYRIPTFAEVVDWFANEKRILIVLEPFFTYSLRDHIAYNWKIYYLDPELNLVLRTEEDEWRKNMGKDGYGGSFNLIASAAIESAMRIKDDELVKQN